MDPAGPGFERMRKERKLNSDDAKYVQCIYTDGDIFGTATEYGCGHENFMMNGGEAQPGCPGATACDHKRAYVYFQESLSPDHQFWGIQCRAYSVPHKNGTMDIIGIHHKRINGTFCVRTDYKSPYALSKDDVLESISNPGIGRNFLGEAIRGTEYAVKSLGSAVKGFFVKDNGD